MSDHNRRGYLRRLTVCALFAALLCVVSPIGIPLGPIPISLGLFGVLLCAVCLSPVMSLTAVTVYVAIGLCGLPVFSGAMGGAPVLAGPTGGYLWSYPLLAPVVGLLCGRGNDTPVRLAVIRAFFACLAGTIICYFFGTLQYVLITQTPIGASLAVCVLPFLPIDICKALLAAVVGKRLSTLLSRRL